MHKRVLQFIFYLYKYTSNMPLIALSFISVTLTLSFLQTSQKSR